jgi:hypothetical protein
MRPLYKGATWGLIFAFGLSSSGLAQNVTIPLDKLPPETAAKVLEAQKQAQRVIEADKVADEWVKANKLPKTPEAVKEWAGIGKEVADALAQTAKALSIEVNEFVKTPVGKMVAFLIIWRLVGDKFWKIIAGTAIWIGAGWFLWRNFSRLHLPREEWVKGAGTDGKGEWRDRTFKWNSKEAKTTSAAFHTGAFIVLSGICMGAIL